MPQRQTQRTAERVSRNLFAQSPIQSYGNKMGAGKKVSDAVCIGLCNVFCNLRTDILKEMLKDLPDVTDTGLTQNFTDLKTVGDLMNGGKCTCNCSKYGSTPYSLT